MAPAPDGRWWVRVAAGLPPWQRRDPVGALALDGYIYSTSLCKDPRMNDPLDYLSGLELRLRADGCEVATTSLPLGPALVGRRSDFRIRWALTRLHLFTIAAKQEHVTLAAIQHFTHVATEYARRAKGGLLLGLQTGIALFPVMVGQQVERDAVAWACEKQRVEFACLARPVVIHAPTGQSYLFRADAALGLVYNHHLRSRAAAYFPEP